MSTSSKEAQVDVRKMMINKSKSRKVSEILEKLIPILLFIITSTSILITIGIVFTLLSKTIEFFKRIPVWDFFTGTVLNPLSQDATFGILPLLVGTVVSSVIAMLVAVSIGLMSAIYLSEYASERVKKIFKPLLELLAGIPTIVYVFFAFSFVSLLLSEVLHCLQSYYILLLGIDQGVNNIQHSY